MPPQQGRSDASRWCLELDNKEKRKAAQFRLKAAHVLWATAKCRHPGSVYSPLQSHSYIGVAFYLKRKVGIRYNILKGQKRSKERESR
uniref:Uncharacterized protein n=1 Tax=Geobacillus sp. (strain WCH70) TaxID=471223 RepID=C5D772_GEOSW